MATTDRFIAPPATIGMLGGGQLGRMSAMAAKHMGYRVIVLTPEDDSPCSQVCDDAIVAPYDDDRALEELARRADVVTYEFENVPAGTAARLEDRTIVHPSSRILHTCRHRLREKAALERLGVPTAPFAPVRSEADLGAAVARLGFPAVLKTTTGGYDGKGQRVVHTMDELAEGFAALRPEGGQIFSPAEARLENGATKKEGTADPDVDAPLILEAFVPFEKELSVIVARNARGECLPFPVSENVHADNILHRSSAPAPVDARQAAEASRLAVRIAEGLGLVGVMGVEMFAGEDFLLVNELAPRPHNSGHYTLDACVTSQFEQHVRAVCNLPLGSPEARHAAVMINVLGEHVAPLLEHYHRLLALPGIKVHLYGKGDARPQRKMGHVTAIAPTVAEARERADAAGRLFLAQPRRSEPEPR